MVRSRSNSGQIVSGQGDVMSKSCQDRSTSGQAHDRLGQVKSKVRSNQGWVKVKSGHVWSDEVRSGQNKIRSGQVRSGEGYDGFGQVRPDQVCVRSRWIRSDLFRIGHVIIVQVR